jgi:hypothetical protein
MGGVNLFLTSAQIGGEWSASRTGRFTYGERALDTHWIGDGVGPRTGLYDAEEKGFPPPGLAPQPLSDPAQKQSLYRLRYYRFFPMLVLRINYNNRILELYPFI